jgi:ABC-2 type transport system permease protein
MKIIIYNELKLIARQKIVGGYLAILLILWAVAMTISYQQYHKDQLIKSSYQKYHRELWINQDPKNPHMAAHYGTFAFKPANPMSIFDSGIGTYSGSFIYLEAHRQNDFVCSPAQNSSVYLRMGQLNLSFLFQIVIPLLLLTLCIGMFNLEKTTGLLPFISVNSFSNQKLLYYKSIALMLISGIIYISLYILTLLSTTVLGIEWQTSNLVSLFLLLTLELLFSYIVILLFLFISFKSRDIKQSTLISLSVFILLFFIFPRLAVNISNNLYVLPSNVTFKDEIKKDVDNGIDGHNSGEKRQRLLIDSVLKANHVDSTYKLPVNIDGIMLLKGEEHSAKVYNEHFSKLKNTVLKQQKMAELFSLISPHLLVKNLSMSLCKTDIESEFSFREQAEAYRYDFVQKLNENMMLKSKENEFNTYKIHKSDFLSIPDFQYKELDLTIVLKNNWQELFLMFVTLLALLFFLKVKL